MPFPLLDPAGWLLSRRYAQRPIFVVGTGRSGTSVLRRSLGHHRQIMTMPGETPFLSSLGGEFSLFEQEKTHDFYHNSLTMPLEELANKLRRLGLEVAGGPHFGLKTLLGLVRSQHRNPLSVKRWCAKTFPTINVTTGLLALYPQAQFLYIIRNGIDVVHSKTRFHGFSEAPFTEHCERWAKGVEKYRYLRTHPAALWVRHEDIVNQPVEFFQKTLAFLNMPYDDGPANYVSGTLVHPLDEGTREEGDIKSVFNNRPPAHQDWSDEQKQIFQSICRDAMNDVGYPIPF